MTDDFVGSASVRKGQGGLEPDQCRFPSGMGSGQKVKPDPYIDRSLSQHQGRGQKLLLLD